MVVCKYYLQGNCRHGNKCWYEHPTGGNAGYRAVAQRQLFGGGGGGQQRVSFRDSFGTNQQNPYKWQSNQAGGQGSGGGQLSQTATMAPIDILKGLSTEMTTWEASKMWPFSCLGFEKEAPSIPGFSDVSFEELRQEAYAAQKSGDSQSYVQRVEALINEVNGKRNEMKNPGMAFKQKMLSFIEDCRRKQSSSSGSSTALFSGTFGSGGTSGGLFSSGSSGSSSSLFDQGFGGGGEASSSGLFGQSSQTFGASQASVFGQSAQQTTFGQGQGQSVFGSQSSGQSVFGQTGQTQTTQSQTQMLFGKPVVSASTESSTGSSAFGSSAQTTPNVTNAFGSSPAFAQPGSAIVPSGSQFGGFSKPAQFGQPVDTKTTGHFSQQQHEQTNTLYTPMDKLTTKELEQFKAPSFTLGLIPTRPPAKELC